MKLNLFTYWSYNWVKKKENEKKNVWKSEWRNGWRLIYLVETDGVGSLAEAASADVETVLADESVAVTADTAIKKEKMKRKKRGLILSV